ncbi:MAG TPA: hypothetical protein VLA87_13405 [Gaiellaceae bacterium]|nr:hypothetical protein [Gaiellaceae bacterium]
MNRHRLRGLPLALASSLVLVGGGSASATVTPETTAEAEIQGLIEEIRKHRAASRHWQRVMGKPRTRTSFLERNTDLTGGVTRLTALRDRWRRKAARFRALGWHPPNRAAWRCIQRREGPWDDPRAPYWGGLQMSMQFQRAFGRYLLRLKGTANRWTPAEQMWTAERARGAGLGFHPWPNTARACGLL